MPGDPSKASVQLSAAAALFLVATLASIGFAIYETSVGPVFTRSIEPATEIGGYALLAATLCILLTGGRLWSIGWSALRRNEEAVLELQRQTDALRLSERRYRASFDHAVVGLLRVAADGTIQTANPALVRMLGYDERHGARRQERDDALPRCRRARSRSSPMSAIKAPWPASRSRWRRRDGQVLTVRVTSRVDRDAQGRLLAFDDIVEDVTERVALGEQLRHAQKMEAVGRLAGGIAHDFNNLLTVDHRQRRTACQRCRRCRRRARQCVDQIRGATASAATVTRQLLMFSRKGATSPQAINVNRAVSYVEKMIARLIGEDIRVFSNLNPAAGTILVDPAHLEQALINLAVNARDAMPQGGVLIFETTSTDNGRRVRIAVRDTGHGMDETTQQRAFEPFFTTKPCGKGTGLGLSMVYGFVQQAGGEVGVSSTVGRGTVVHMEFPCVGLSVASLEDEPTVEYRGTERVLVVEDQDSVRSLVSGVLEKRGFTVFQAPNARDARRVLAAEPGIDLVITDVVMPGESGLELADWLRTTYPRIQRHAHVGVHRPSRHRHAARGESAAEALHAERAADARARRAQSAAASRDAGAGTTANDGGVTP